MTQKRIYGGEMVNLMLYYDELELCNPLGSRHKQHNIGNGVD